MALLNAGRTLPIGSKNYDSLWENKDEVKYELDSLKQQSV